MLTYEKNLTTGITREYAYLNNQIIGWQETDNTGNSVKRYAATDLIGSVTTVTDESGTVLWSGDYTAFGNVAYGSGDVLYDGMYTGKDIDSETGLTYHWNRWRNEDGSSFISEDPARDGSNWYGYCGNNPINSTDPTGLTAEENSQELIRQYAKSKGATEEEIDKILGGSSEGPEQGPTEPQKPEIKQPTIYYDNYGNPSTDPHVVTGRNVGEDYSSETIRKNIVASICETIKKVADDLVKKGMTYKDGGMCDGFVKQVLEKASITLNNFLYEDTDGKSVGDHMTMASLGFRNSPEVGASVVYMSEGVEGKWRDQNHMGILIKNENGSINFYDLSKSNNKGTSQNLKNHPFSDQSAFEKEYKNNGKGYTKYDYKTIVNLRGNYEKITYFYLFWYNC